MQAASNLMENNALATLTRQAGPQIAGAIKKAATATGVDFAYLMEKAAAESSFKTDIKAATSSATGLFQFIEGTWLDMVKKHGGKYGLEDLAAKIGPGNNIADPAAKKEILELRKNPETASLLAAEFALENKRHMERYLDSEIGATELYFAHFMGASGATGFLKAHNENPLAVAADLFPEAARANRNVFYDPKTGEPRTLAGVYEFFDRKFTDQEQSRVNSLKSVSAPAPVPAAKPRQLAAQMIEHHARIQEQTVRRFISHPYMQKVMNDPSYGWRRENLAAPAAMVVQPIELMLLAQMAKLPGEERNAY